MSYYPPLLGERLYIGRVLKHQNSNEWHAEACEFIEAIPGGIKGKRVLDFGCGPGAMSYLMWLFGAQAVDGVDSSAMRAWAKRHYPRGPNFIDSPEGKYDVIVCSHVIGHLDWPHLRLTGLLDYLTPDGVVAVLNPNALNTYARALPNWLKRYKHDPTLRYHFSKSQMDALMQHSGMHCISWYRTGKRWGRLPAMFSCPLFGAFYGRSQHDT
jgi:trans-aconitate methyltransferase